jgi:hypothetical protein
MLTLESSESSNGNHGRLSLIACTCSPLINVNAIQKVIFLHAISLHLLDFK